jgi:uncharacterized protein YlaI
MKQQLNDPIREKLCTDCKAKYDKPEPFNFCANCAKLFEPKKENKKE